MTIEEVKLLIVRLIHGSHDASIDDFFASLCRAISLMISVRSQYSFPSFPIRRTVIPLMFLAQASHAVRYLRRVDRTRWLSW